MSLFSLRSFFTPVGAGIATFALTALLPGVALADQVVFSEDWQSGTSAWNHPFDAIAVATATDPALCSSTFQRETTPSTTGRVFANHGIPVTAGQAYCLTAWVRGSVASEPFVGYNLSDQAGNGTATEHWLMGAEDNFDDGLGGTATRIMADGNWHFYTKSFTPEAGSTFVILKDEIYEGDDGTLAGTGDFDDITLIKGACPAAPIGAAHAACTGAKAACDTDTGACVECLTEATCSATKPSCDRYDERTICGKADQGSDVTLTCPVGTVIDAIAFSSYGTPDGACGAFTLSADAACDAATSMSAVMAVCVNENTCTVTADDATFANTCTATAKRLYVQATCNAGGGEVCVACDGDNGGATKAKCPTAGAPICLGTGACAECATGKTDACTGAKPFCDTVAGNCVGCNGNNGSATTHPCGAAAPFCNATSGVCSATCTVDADCGAAHWCAAGACVAQLANGVAIPTVASHTPVLDGTCASAAVGTAVCVSGVCDSKNNQCGLANGDGPCAKNADCDSQKCNTTSHDCAVCLLDTDCTATQFCDDGDAGACTARLANGATCARKEQCVSAACATNDKCGKLDGTACVNASECQTAQCSSGSCGPPDAGTDAGPPDAASDAAVGPAADASTPVGDDAGVGADVDAAAEAGDTGGDSGGGGCSIHTDGPAGGGGAAIVGLFGALIALGRRRRRAA